MKELLEKIESLYEAEKSKLEEAQRTTADLRTELTVAKNRVQQVENEMAELKKKWDKAQKLFGGLQ